MEVDWPEAGPPLCTLTMTHGDSTLAAIPIPSCMRQKPGPLVAVIALAPPQEAPTTATMAAISSSACRQKPSTSGSRRAIPSRISVAGVMG